MILSRDSCEPWRRADTLALAALLLFSILVRLPHLVAPYVINKDAIHYIDLAKIISRGDLWYGLSQSRSSLYPVLIALLQPLAKDWVAAARILSVVFGILTAIPFYLVARQVLDLRGATIASLFLCLAPAFLSSSLEIIRGPIFWFFFALFLWLLIKAWSQDRLSLYLLAGAVGTLGTAFRFEGVLLLPVGACFALYQAFRSRAPLRAIPRVIALLLPILLVALAVLQPLSQGRRLSVLNALRSALWETKVALSGGRPVQAAVETSISESRYPIVRRFFRMAWDERWAVLASKLLKKWIHAAHPLLFFLMLLGLCHRSLWSRPIWQLLAFLMLVWISVGYIILSATFGFNKRWLVPLVMIGLLFAAQGFETTGEGMSRRWSRISKRTLSTTMIILVTLVLLPSALTPQRQDKIARRRAGEWIRSLGITNPFIVTERPRVTFYAEGRSVSYDRLRKSSSGESAFFVLSFGIGETKAADDKLAGLGRLGWEICRTREFRSKKEIVRVYQLRRTSRSVE